MPITFEKRQFVTPGDLLAEGVEYEAGENTYKEGDCVYAQRLGLVDSEGNRVFIVSLKGRYIPRVGDLVIGQVVDVSLGGWLVDINSPYVGILSVSDVTGKSFSPKLASLTSILGIGELVVAEVVAFDRTRDPAITIQGSGLGRVSGGVAIELTPSKIPRLIGKKGSMISMLKNSTGCDIVVGQNGKIFIRGRDPEQVDRVINAIKMIEEKAHTSGLTDRVKAFLSKR